MDLYVRYRIGLALAATGLLTALAIFATDSSFWTAPPGLHVIAWIFGASTVGAGLGGLATAPLFGRPGPRGWRFAALGSVLATALGGAIGGSLIFPGYGTVLGAIFVFTSIADRPTIAPLWLVAMIAVHLYARRQQDRSRLTESGGCP